jgi:hypothetical protein
MQKFNNDGAYLVELTNTPKRQIQRRRLAEKQEAVGNKNKKLGDRPITTSCLTKVTSSLKVSPIGLGSTTERPHMRALIGLEGIKTKKKFGTIWHRFREVNQDNVVLQE